MLSLLTPRSQCDHPPRLICLARVLLRLRQLDCFWGFGAIWSMQSAPFLPLCDDFWAWWEGLGPVVCVYALWRSWAGWSREFCPRLICSFGWGWVPGFGPTGTVWCWPSWSLGSVASDCYWSYRCYCCCSGWRLYARGSGYWWSPWRLSSHHRLSSLICSDAAS